MAKLTFDDAKIEAFISRSSSGVGVDRRDSESMLVTVSLPPMDNAVHFALSRDEALLLSGALAGLARAMRQGGMG